MIPDITYLPYMSWREWINECGKYKVGIHMMRTHAAGTFSMNIVISRNAVFRILWIRHTRFIAPTNYRS